VRPGEQELPWQLTPFIGRSAELKDITRLLDDPACRLLTLLGPGGIGKTRLAIEAARQQADHFPDGLYWVDLQPGQTADFLVTALAEALSLSLSGQDDPRQQLLRTLQDKTVLLILDNFEQFQDGPKAATG
jgi:predicted ATPase